MTTQHDDGLPQRSFFEERPPISMHYHDVRRHCLREPDDELVQMLLALLADEFGPAADLPSVCELRTFGALACEELYFWVREGVTGSPRHLLRAAAARAFKPLMLPPRPAVLAELWARHHPAGPEKVAEVAAALRASVRGDLTPEQLRTLRIIPRQVLHLLFEEAAGVGCLQDVDQLIERSLRRCYKTTDPALWSWFHVLEVEAA